jgi:hypothetical protein
MMNILRRFLAWTRFSKKAVCEESIPWGEWSDYHDYPDSKEYQQDYLGPVHFYKYTCVRCGKGFYI